MRKCIKCGLPETYQRIKFDKMGVCNYCNFYEEIRDEVQDWDGLEKKFAEKVKQIKKKAKKNGARYDVMIGVSGGKDSTYVLYQLVHKYKLRVLAFTYENGFSTPYMHDNIAEMLKKLDVDYVRIVPKESFLKHGNTVAVKYIKNFCILCGHFLWYNSFLTAHEKKIPAIINGRSRGQTLQFATSKKMLEPFETPSNLREFEYIMRHMVNGALLKVGEAALNIDYLDEVNVDSISYFMYHPYNEEEVKAFIEEKIGWKRPESNLKHADCWAHGIAEYYYLQSNGYPIITGDIAVDVREGNITLEDALAQIEKEAAEYKEVNPEELQRFKERISNKY